MLRNFIVSFRTKSRMEKVGIVATTYSTGVVVTFIGAFYSLTSVPNRGMDFLSGPFAASIAIVWPLAVPFLIGEGIYRKITNS